MSLSLQFSIGKTADFDLSTPFFALEPQPGLLRSYSWFGGLYGKFLYYSGDYMVPSIGVQHAKCVLPPVKLFLWSLATVQSILLILWAFISPWIRGIKLPLGPPYLILHTATSVTCGTATLCQLPCLSNKPTRLSTKHTVSPKLPPLTHRFLKLESNQYMCKFLPNSSCCLIRISSAMLLGCMRLAALGSRLATRIIWFWNLKVYNLDAEGITGFLEHHQEQPPSTEPEVALKDHQAWPKNHKKENTY